MERLLTDICKLQYGYAFDSAKFTTNAGVPLIRIRDVVRGFSETFTTEECDPEYIVQDGDILVGMDGEFNIARWKGGKAYLNQRVCRLIPTDEVDSTYLFYFMPKALKAIEDKTPFVTVKHLSAKELNKIVVPLPPIKEQKEISYTLQKLDDLISLRKQQLSKLDELVKSRFVELFDEKGYPTLKWNDVFNTTTGKLDSNAMVENGEYPFFTCAKEVFRIDKYAFDQEALLLAGNNAAGKYDVKYYKGKFNAYQRTYVLGLKEEWSYQLFRYQLEDKLEYLQQQSLGGLTKYLTLKILGELEFIVPPMNKQNEFATFAEQTGKSKFEIQKSLEKLETLKKALMQKYFGHGE